MSNVDTLLYDQVKFKGNGKTLSGIKIGKYLAVVERQEGIGYKIFRLDGYLVLDTVFIHQNDAIRFATWLDEKFGEFFPIWDEYPEIDLFGLVKWSIEDGIRLYETIKNLDTQPKIESLKDVNDAYYEVEENVRQWDRFGSSDRATARKND